MTNTFIAAAHPYISMAEVADLVNQAAKGNTWDARQARRILGRARALTNIGGRVYTTRRRLREALPDLWDEIVLRFDDAQEDDV